MLLELLSNQLQEDSNRNSNLTFAQVIQFLIYAEIIDRPGVWGAESVLDVPDWAKQNGCWWEADLISDEEFINVILYLIDEGIIMVY